MAFISQEEKTKLSPAIKAICKKYGLKGSLSIKHHSTLVLTISAGQIDFISNYNDCIKVKCDREHKSFTPAEKYIQVNPYWFREHFAGRAKEFFEEVVPAMKGQDWFDNSDSQTDYFHVKHYFDINIGRWNKPYVLSK